MALGSPLGPLMANVFMCRLEKKANTRWLYASSVQYVDDTPARIPCAAAAAVAATAAAAVLLSPFISALKLSRTELKLKLKFT